MERELARAQSPARARRTAQRGAAAADADRERRGARATFRRRGHGIHGVPPRSADPDRPRLHGAGAARPDRAVPPRPARVLHRGRLPRPRDDAHARLSLVRLAQMVKEPHADPIRRGPLLYNIFITRTEGHATGWEEMMMQAGMFDARPRSRELIYILLAQRAARALGDLRMHAEPDDARTGGGVRVGEHAARLAAPRRQHRARRAAPVSAAAGLRHQLRDRQDPDRGAARRHEAPARRRPSR